MAEGLALVIEDSMTQANIVGRMLKDEDWDYVVARSLAECHDVLLQQRPNLIFVDVFLGEDNSLDHITQIRDRALDATIAIMTAGSRDASVDSTLKLARSTNVDYVLRKPFSRQQMRAIVESAQADASEGRKRKHALVIDDSHTVATLTAQTLSDNGYRVSIAHSMEEALDNEDIAHVDLIVSDIFMPGMGGLQGIRVIKSTWPNVRILAMSAGLDARVSSDRATSAAMAAGADAEIQKPFRPVELINTAIKLMAS
ncbi:response regulator [Asticcacaulis excentricus]|jgi:DNA-binding response OmpR family regulator|uniref:Response regulator receiver protein n=1 Tax=Asticcacaulis excentricus TaxID=78587 RepID=A0A3G9G744_9CAUL|nr:response regulator [Asticcacaulis excentricus]BBF80088.1 response regulator receiver protein [Asticcacaulis excentricus]